MSTGGKRVVHFEDQAFAAPTGYPLYREFAGKKIKAGARRSWPIDPICGCFDMSDCGVNCCCATCCCVPFTWGNFLRYAGISSEFSVLTQLAAGVDLGKGAASELAELGLDYAAVRSAQQKREELSVALGLERVNDGLWQRWCCGPCIQLQENEAVFRFYRNSLGYKDLAYGPWYKCECRRLTTRFPPAYNPASTRRRVVPYPEYIMRDDTPGPNYPNTTGAEHGYFFVGGVPTKNETPYVEPPSNTPPARRPLLPGFAQPSRRPK